MFKQRNVPTSELISTPAPRYAGQSLEFRPPEKRQAPPAWWVGPLAGDLAGGGGFSGQSVIHQYWRDFAAADDVFVVQLVAEDIIVGDGVRRFTRLERKVKTEISSSAQARRMAVALIEAADILDRS